MLKATFDTNVLVSGLIYRRGKPYELLQRALAGEISLTVSQPILDEMADVLIRKFDGTLEDVTEAIGIVTQAARTVKPSVQLDVIKEDPTDDRILECAVSAGSDYIVTGDNHLLGLRQYDAIRIVSPSDFLDTVRGQATQV